jgi:hypothetical protein
MKAQGTSHEEESTQSKWRNNIHIQTKDGKHRPYASHKVTQNGSRNWR